MSALFHFKGCQHTVTTSSVAGYFEAFGGCKLSICKSQVLCVPLPGKHISLVICVPLPRKHIPLVICVPLPGKHIIPSGMCFPYPGTIPSDMCSSNCEPQITDNMCSPTRKTHFPNDTCMCCPTQETHIPSDMCFLDKRAHITSDI